MGQFQFVGPGAVVELHEVAGEAGAVVVELLEVVRFELPPVRENELIG